MSKKEKEVEVVSVKGVKEVPENEEVVDEVSEEVVQAVAEAIDEFAKEENKKVEEVVNDIIEEANEEYTGDLRGFKTLAEAKNYPNTPEFQKLDIGCRTEYVNWLNSITKED